MPDPSVISFPGRVLRSTGPIVLLSLSCIMKEYEQIDYAFRPASYTSDPTPRAAVLRNIKGENRRQMISHFFEKGRLEHLKEDVLEPTLSEEGRRHFGWMHPTCLGGEDLPDYLPGEVESARLTLDDDGATVISLRARALPNGLIAYRALDEADQHFMLPITESELPLTLAELIQQFDQGNIEESYLDGGLGFGFNAMNPEKLDPPELRDFTYISSEFYDELADHYVEAFDDWMAELLGDADDGDNATA